MNLILIALGAVVAGVIQSIAGFGAGMMLMLFLPYLVGLVQATGLTTAICMTLSIVLFVQYRKKADYVRVTSFSVAYIAVSALIISFIKKVDLHYLTIAFGFFLMFVSVKNLFGKRKMKIDQTIPMALLFGAIGGLCSGFFAMGGPFWAMYFLSSSDDRDAYMGNTQACATFTAIAETTARAANGIFTLDIIPMIIIGMIFINIWKKLVINYAKKLDSVFVGKLVYVFVGICGIITIIKQFSA